MEHIIDPDDRRPCMKRLTGMPNVCTFHIWNWIIILDSIGKYVMFQTNLFGHYAIRKGILSMYSQEMAGIVFFVVYSYHFCAGDDNRDFVVLFLYKLNTILLIIICACYAIDSGLWIFDKHTFCNMQLEKRATCDERNQFFLIQAAIFYFIWTPLWYLCGEAERRYG